MGRELLDICCNDLQSQAIMPQVQDRIIRQVPELWGEKLYKDIEEMYDIKKKKLFIKIIDDKNKKETEVNKVNDRDVTIKDFFLEYYVYNNRFLLNENRHTLEITQYAINCEEKNQSHNVQLQQYFYEYTKALNNETPDQNNEISDQSKTKKFFKNKMTEESKHGRRTHDAYILYVGNKITEIKKKKKEIDNKELIKYENAKKYLIKEKYTKDQDDEKNKPCDCKAKYPQKCLKHVGCMLRRKMIDLAHGDFDAVDGKRLYSSTVRKELLSNIPDKPTFRLVIEAILDVRLEYT